MYDKRHVVRQTPLQINRRHIWYGIDTRSNLPRVEQPDIFNGEICAVARTRLESTRCVPATFIRCGRKPGHVTAMVSAQPVSSSNTTMINIFRRSFACNERFEGRRRRLF